MKKILVLVVVMTSLLWACSNEKGAYLDLRTGEKINIEKDPATGYWVNADTKEPVYIYVDSKKNDTIYGRTGNVINGHVVKYETIYWYDQDEDYKAKFGDYKRKVDDDGDVKIKTDDKKIKIDGETGEKKVKND